MGLQRVGHTEQLSLSMAEMNTFERLGDAEEEGPMVCGLLVCAAGPRQASTQGHFGGFLK